MKRFPFLLAACVAATVVTAAGSSFAATNAGVSVQVGQPGFYGRIDIGNTAPPMVIYPQPIVVAPAPVGIARQPIYLHVPPGHAKNWGKHCARYNACGQPVYFVQDSWYQQQYVPQQQGYRDNRGYGDDRRGDRNDHDRGDRGDRENNAHAHGQGRGNGHGHGHGRD